MRIAVNVAIGEWKQTRGTEENLPALPRPQ